MAVAVAAAAVLAVVVVVGKQFVELLRRGSVKVREMAVSV